MVVIDDGLRANRREQRASLGPLRGLVISKATEKRYESAMKQFFDWLEDEDETLPTNATTLDRLACRFIEHAWEEGEARAVISNLLAGLQHEMPHVRRCLNGSWRLLSAWQRKELPSQCPPLSWELACAISGEMLKRCEPEAATVVLLGFKGLLRTGEFLRLRKRDIHINLQENVAVLNLGLTKEGLRLGSKAATMLKCSTTVPLLAATLLHRADDAKVFTAGTPRFRRIFSESCAALQLTDCNFKPYSLRRGGATHLFEECGSLDTLLTAGRWQNQRTCRLYINSAMAALASMRVPPSAKALAERSRHHLEAILAPRPNVNKRRRKV